MPIISPSRDTGVTINCSRVPVSFSRVIAIEVSSAQKGCEYVARDVLVHYSNGQMWVIRVSRQKAKAAG